MSSPVGWRSRDHLGQRASGLAEGVFISLPCASRTAFSVGAAAEGRLPCWRCRGTGRQAWDPPGAELNVQSF